MDTARFHIIRVLRKIKPTVSTGGSLLHIGLRYFGERIELCQDLCHLLCLRLSFLPLSQAASSQATDVETTHGEITRCLLSQEDPCKVSRHFNNCVLVSDDDVFLAQLITTFY